MDNKSAFNTNQYDENVRKVILLYDEIYKQIFSLINAYYGDEKISVLDTGCGTGTFGLKACEILTLSELILCDPSEKMLSDAKIKLSNNQCEFMCVGSENLDFESRFDVVTAIQSHHYFDRTTREKAIMFETPEAYAKLDNAVSRHLGLPDKRTRYHNPYIKAKDIISDGEKSQ